MVIVTKEFAMRIVNVCWEASTLGGCTVLLPLILLVAAGVSLQLIVHNILNYEMSYEKGASGLSPGFHLPNLGKYHESISQFKA